MSQALRLGILGMARIARLFVEGLKESTAVQVVAVGSRNIEAAREFAQLIEKPGLRAQPDALRDMLLSLQNMATLQALALSALEGRVIEEEDTARRAPT